MATHPSDDLFPIVTMILDAETPARMARLLLRTADAVIELRGAAIQDACREVGSDWAWGTSPCAQPCSMPPATSGANCQTTRRAVWNCGAGVLWRSREGQLAKPFATLRLTFPAPYAGKPVVWEGDITADPSENPDAYRQEAGELLTAFKEKLREPLQEKAP